MTAPSAAEAPAYGPPSFTFHRTVYGYINGTHVSFTEDYPTIGECEPGSIQQFIDYLVTNEGLKPTKVEQGQGAPLRDRLDPPPQQQYQQQPPPQQGGYAQQPQQQGAWGWACPVHGNEFVKTGQYGTECKARSQQFEPWAKDKPWYDRKTGQNWFYCKHQPGRN